ncbi:E3 SUMO-protein ligase NSE2 isoform X2 [Amia ocellicauda]|uniref:E3 SUMO-protein ligase NSE2 isoform X2 n=1 Tax=Amia ocellicauda TaxID=2972642 RepID=UPI003464E876
MSFSVVNQTLSSLKTCQSDISTGIDIVTEVALDLAETGGNEEDLKKLEQIIFDCARIDRKISQFTQAVEGLTTQVRHEQPEMMSELKGLVQEKFAGLQATARDSDLHKHKKVVEFKQNLRKANFPVSEGTEEELDEDIAVTQSQMNPTCPITQVEMVNPVKNKKCNHYYDQEAAINMIKTKQNQKKKFRCPVVGCGNADVKQPDLVPDAAMKRFIQNRKKHGGRS